MYFASLLSGSLPCSIEPKYAFLVQGSNEGGDVDHSKAIFSNLTDVVVEGKGLYVAWNILQWIGSVCIFVIRIALSLQKSLKKKL